MATRIKCSKLSLQTEAIEDWFEQWILIATLENVVEPDPLGANATAQRIADNNAAHANVCRHFLTSIETPVYTLLKSLVSPDDLMTKHFSELKDLLINHLKPKPTVLSERYRFYHMKQGQNENSGDYIARLQAQIN